ncbi:MAG: acetoacetyl-CoA synthase [Betaproteobacteria bacterium RIFCSPLOWO2_02_FULL_62_17]|nr:MAG: acetoacetyl-CoA synthase [Betaproteobacteria bacterium RIFCSPLOWO2_02_FULL_62_17]
MNARPPAAALKRPTNLSINADLLDKARKLGVNLSQTLEDRLGELVREAEARDWLKKNQRAINAYNERVAREGVWSDGVRGF